MQCEWSPHTRVGNRDYRLSHGFIEIKSENIEDKQPWRIVVPVVEDARIKILQEMYSVPYAGHMGYHKAFKRL